MGRIPALERYKKPMLTRLRRFFVREDGSVLVEAAIVIPIALMMFLGMAEFSTAFTAQRKASIVTSTMADLVSQAESVTTAALSDIVSVSNSIMAPYPASRLSITITSVGLDTHGNSIALWSCAWAAVTAAPSCASNGAAFTLPAGLLVQPTDTVIVAQTRYNFKPPVGQFLLGGLTFSQAAYFRPRLTAAVTKL